MILRPTVSVLGALLVNLVVAPDDPVDRLVEKSYLRALARSASIAGSQGRHEDALSGFEAVRDHHRLRAERNPADDGAQLALASAGADVGLALYMLGEFERAAAAFEPYIARLDERLAAAPDDALVAFDRLRRGVPFCEILIKAARLDDAIAECRRTLALCDELANADADNANLPRFRTTLVYDLGWAHQERAEAAIDAGADPRSDGVRADLAAALQHLRSANAMFRKAAAAGQLDSATRVERITGRIEAVERLIGER